MKHTILTVAALTLVFFSLQPQMSSAQVPTESNYSAEVFNLGRKVNSNTVDIFPYVSNEGTKLYFTSRRQTPNEDDIFEKLFYCTREDPQQSWGPPQSMIGFNGPRGSGAICFDTTDHMYLSVCTNSVANNIYAIFEGSSAPGKSLTVRELPWPINDPHTWNCQMSVTADGKTMYFVSNRRVAESRERGNGTSIYVSHRLTDSTWSMPIRLGKHINRSLYNASPCISPDGTVLFFASERVSLRHYVSLYYAKKTGPGDDDWSESTALPAPINADKNAICPTILPDGKTIYFASDRDGGCGMLDLYSGQLPPSVLSDIGQAFVRKGF